MDGSTPALANRSVYRMETYWLSAVAVVDQSALMSRAAGIKCLLKCIRCPAGDCIAIYREGRTQSVLADRDAFQPSEA